jgi:hypothetical protein
VVVTEGRLPRAEAAGSAAVEIVGREAIAAMVACQVVRMVVETARQGVVTRQDTQFG